MKVKEVSTHYRHPFESLHISDKKKKKQLLNNFTEKKKKFKYCEIKRVRAPCIVEIEIK